MSDTRKGIARQVGPELGAFVRWLVDGEAWSLAELLDVLEHPDQWEPEYRQWQLEQLEASAPTRDELEGKERAAR